LKPNPGTLKRKPPEYGFKNQNIGIKLSCHSKLGLTSSSLIAWSASCHWQELRLMLRGMGGACDFEWESASV
jgi:hypothetical protein